VRSHRRFLAARGHQVSREAVYLFYGKLSVYLKALGRDAGLEWAAWVG
jgi:hypothetical protein